VSLIKHASSFVFQSTLPARGATRVSCSRLCRPLVSIHAPRAGSDHHANPPIDWSRSFNPRSPRGERPPARRQHSPIGSVSIHAPRAGSDAGLLEFVPPSAGFNPRSPRGERHQHDKVEIIKATFQSTLPARGATRFQCRCCGWLTVSIHAPRAGSDANSSPRAKTPSWFQSTLPARGATSPAPALVVAIALFQSTLPARGATQITG